MMTLFQSGVWLMSWKIAGRLMLVTGIFLLSLSGCVKQPPENELIDSESEMKTVRIVSSTWEPYEYEEDGVAKGIGVDVTVEVFKRMGYEATVTFVPFKRALDMIQSGEADMLTDVNKNEEREVYAIFIEEPILMSYTNLFVNTDKFELLSLKRKEHTWVNNGIERFSSYWIVKVKK